MKHFFTFVLTILLIFYLSSCNTSKQIKPVKEEYIDFDIDTATEIIKAKEKLIVDLSGKEKITVKEFKEVEKIFTEEFGQHANDILSMYIHFGAEDEMVSGMYKIHETFYPTVFHKGIEVTGAVIYKSYYENDFFNETRLTVREEYSGDDERLKDWKREYIFNKNEKGEWEIYSFSGVMNFSFNARYLELKE